MFIIFFILGLIIGSFLNVVVYRIQTAESILGRSKCPHCQKQIRWYDNIPLLSFILLNFQCRDCKAKISWQYPLVELLTGIIFALIGWKFFDISIFQSWILTIYYLIFASFLLIILVYDFLYMEIPSIILWPAIVLAIIFNLYFDLQDGFLLKNWLISESYRGLISALPAFLFFFSLSYFSKEKWMGMGDAYLAILLGLILGWPQTLLALMLAFSIGAICGIILIGFKKKTMQSQIPFAPFMILGTLLAIFWGEKILNYYFSISL